MQVRRTEPATVSALPAGEQWFTAGRFLIILGGLLLVSFPQVIFGVETFFYRDFGNFAYPAALFHQEAFWRGELPLWNPLHYCGIPFLAQWNTLTLYPLSLFYVVFPLAWSLGVFCLLHWLLGGLGMSLLAHRWTASRLGATLGGLMFAFNGVTWHCVALPNYLVALAWWPWVLLAAEGVVQGGRRQVILGALVGAMQMLSGAPEIILLTWICVGVLWVRDWCGAGNGRWWMLARLVAMPLLVAALASAQLLPFLQLVANAQRDATFGGVGDTQGAIPATGWANYFVPLFHLYPTPQGAYVQRQQFFFGSYYLGIGTVALAVLAVWRKGDGRLRLLAAMAVLSVVLAMGDHGWLYTAVKRLIPQLGVFRFPVKFTLLPVLVGPLLLASAVGWVMSAPVGEWLALRRRLLVVGGGVGAVIVLLAACAWKAPLPGDVPSATVANAILRGTFLAAIVLCLLGLRRAADVRRWGWYAGALPLLFWLDVYTHQPRLAPTIPVSVYEPDSVRENFHWTNQLHAGESRAMESLASMNRLLSAAAPDPVIDFNGRRLAMYSDYNELDHIPKVDGSYSLYPRAPQEVIAGLYTAREELAPLEDFMGVAQISDPANPVGWVSRTGFMPLVTIGQEPMASPAEVVRKRVLSTTFRPQEEVLLPLEAAATVQAKRCAEARIVGVTNATQELLVEVESPAPAMLVVAQAYYPCWQAEVDGNAVTLWRANHAFQSVEVPAGRHLVRIFYTDGALRIGAVISILGLLACLVAGRTGQLPREV